MCARACVRARERERERERERLPNSMEMGVLENVLTKKHIETYLEPVESIHYLPTLISLQCRLVLSSFLLFRWPFSFEVPWEKFLSFYSCCMFCLSSNFPNSIWWKGHYEAPCMLFFHSLCDLFFFWGGGVICVYCNLHNGTLLAMQVA